MSNNNSTGQGTAVIAQSTASAAPIHEVAEVHTTMQSRPLGKI